MTQEEFKQSEWYKEQSKVIQEAIEIRPPTQLYKFADTGKQCYIIGYSDPGGYKGSDGPSTEVTCVVQKTGIGGPMAAMGLGVLDTNQVFGVALADLVPWEETSSS